MDTSSLRGVATLWWRRRRHLQSSLSSWTVCGRSPSSSPPPSSSTNTSSSPSMTTPTPVSLGPSLAAVRRRGRSRGEEEEGGQWLVYGITGFRSDLYLRPFGFIPLRFAEFFCIVFKNFVTFQNVHCEIFKNHRFSELTFSLWGYVWDHLDDFINPLYQPEEQEILEPSTDIRHLK